MHALIIRTLVDCSERINRRSSSGAGIWLSPADTVGNAPQKGKVVPRLPEKWGWRPSVSCLLAGEAQYIGLTTAGLVRHQAFGLPLYTSTLLYAEFVTYRWELCRVLVKTTLPIIIQCKLYSHLGTVFK